MYNTTDAIYKYKHVLVHEVHPCLNVHDIIKNKSDKSNTDNV